jgi:hypothetical protein
MKDTAPGKETGVSTEFHHVAGSLRPTTSKSTSRYDGGNMWVGYLFATLLQALNVEQSSSCPYIHSRRTLPVFSGAEVSKVDSGRGVKLNSCNRPTYLAPQWSTYVHPEGQRYFHRNSALQVVTEANIYCTETRGKISNWAKQIEDTLLQKGVPLSNSVELFLQFDGSDCAYYLVDHATRTEFWLDDLETEHLNILPVVSISHLSQYSI